MIREKHRPVMSRTTVFALSFAFFLLSCAAQEYAFKGRPEVPGIPDRSLADSLNIADGRMPEYRIGIGDKMEVDFLYNKDLNRYVKVRPDGRISLPYVGDVDAEGMTPTGLDSLLTMKFREILASPEIAVIVTETEGNNIYVLGEVRFPGAIEIKTRMTLLEAITVAGGFLPTGNLKSVIVISKRSETEATATKVNVRRILDKGKYGDDILLARYDIVYVPSSFINNVDIFVDQFFTKTVYNMGIGLMGWQNFIRERVY
ncbi:MAG: polysaccharide biosynthesis/export family protein [Candidatus Eisenbacteria bacterium]|nr:polysaccharide biosynthesis/export family protein [Candidatus Eisenbacteria bacterium]